MNNLKTRREFLGEASCASLSSISVLSSILNLKLANNAAAAQLPVGSDRKTLVCILLDGGCDTFNLLVRRDSGYTTYSNSRTNMALGSGGDAGSGGASYLTNLNQITPNDGNLYGVHPNCGGIADMFNGTGPFAGNRRLSFVANVGTLVRPTNMTDYGNGFMLPKSLFSHIDQITQWQTAVPQGLSELKGFAGRMADVLNSTLNTGATSMSISLAGNNTFQIGDEVTQLAITKDGALLPTGNSPGLGNETARKNFAIDGLVSATYNNMIQDAFATHVKNSHDAQEAFNSVYNTVNDSNVNGVNVGALFGSDNLAQQLRAAAKTISVRSALGLRRNTIFIKRGGWDHHGELLNTQAGMLTELSNALSAYQQALEAYGVADEVISYTASDFGRTLRSNGQGTDHAWGGNQMVFGGPIEAGKVFGTFPDLTLDGPDDIGLGGRILPSTSTDKFFEEMACWFGVQNADLPFVLPNIANFSTEPTLGFVS